MPVTEDYKLQWKGIDQDALREILIEEHDFGALRVEKTIKDLQKTHKARKQKNLGAWA